MRITWDGGLYSSEQPTLDRDALVLKWNPSREFKFEAHREGRKIILPWRSMSLREAVDTLDHYALCDWPDLKKNIGHDFPDAVVFHYVPNPDEVWLAVARVPFAVVTIAPDWYTNAVKPVVTEPLSMWARLSSF